MSETNDKLSRSQVLAVIFTALLSPVTQPLQEIAIGIAGRTAWISVALTAIPLVVIVVFMKALLKTRNDGEGLAEIICRALGPILGRVVVFVYALWMILFTAFMLRSGSERFSSAIFPQSRPWIFAAGMLLLIMIAALGKAGSLGRFAEVLRPVLIIIFVLICLFSVSGVKASNLLPISRLDAAPTLTAVLPLLNVMSVIVFISFLERYTDAPPIKARQFLLPLLTALLFLTVLDLEVIGSYGAELAGKLRNPFFLMVRGISVFGTLERIEAVVIAVWVVTDFVLGSALLTIASDNIALSFGVRKSPWLVVAVCAAALAAALTMAPTALDLDAIISGFWPVINAALVFALLPLIYIIGKLRKKI